MLKTIESEQHLHNSCQKITKIDKKIRFVGVVNEKGRLVTGAVKNKIKFLVDEKDREMLFMEVALRTRMRREFDHYFGPSNFCISHRENVIIMKFPIGNETFYISAEKGIALNKIPFQILEVLKKINHN